MGTNDYRTSDRYEQKRSSTKTFIVKLLKMHENEFFNQRNMLSEV